MNAFLQDIFISLIDLNWGWIFLLFAAGFFLSWLGFAVVWYLTFLAHGDLDPVNQVPFQASGYELRLRRPSRVEVIFSLGRVSSNPPIIFRSRCCELKYPQLFSYSFNPRFS